MADTLERDQQTQAQTNGPVAVEDLTAEEEKAKMRPADIDQDVREMERRKRVDAIMNSRLFREELERIIEQQLKEGAGGNQGGLLQQISEMMNLGGRLSGSKMYRSGNSCLIPINDIRGVDSMAYVKGEKILRCKLAAVYRLIDLFGWTQGIYNHITVRVSQDQEHFLLNPFGMLYQEITASSLIKVDMQGNTVEQGTSNFGVSIAGYMLHSAVHAARPDIRCIIHLHGPAVVAVSALKCGLLPVSQEALLIGECSYHEYHGILINAEERELIGRNLGPMNKVMFLRNHGVVCCGESVEEAFYNAYHTVLACEAQIKMMPFGVENLSLVSDEAKEQAYETARKGGGGVDSYQEGGVDGTEKKMKRWRVGELEFEALMRMLDNAGFRTGYIYKHPLVRSELPRARNDIELPPATSSLGYLLEEEEMYRHSPLKKILEGRRSQDKTRWLNSPNVYQKVEILETGTPDPKKITKWVAEGSPTHSTPIKVDSALQFVPSGTHPHEFKTIQKQIKENRRAGGVSAGPQSHILEGLTWDEAKMMQDANVSGTSDQVILVGAASKGIIQRDYQHNAIVYKTPYAKNPFDSVTDEEIDEYKRIIEKKQRGEPLEEEVPSQPLQEQPSMDESTTGDATTPVADESAKFPSLSPTSPTSDADRMAKPRVLKVETKQAPRPSQAEPHVINADEEGNTGPDFPEPYVQRSKSARYPAREESAEATGVTLQRSQSLERPKKEGKGEPAVNGDEPDAHQSTFSQSSKEGSPTKDISTEESSSPKKEKKKKGLRTPSFLKKKKKKEKKAAEA